MTAPNVGDRIDPITAALFVGNAPDPAPETVTLLRSTVTYIADTLDQGEQDKLVTHAQLRDLLDLALKEAKEQLWAMHCVGASEIWPMLDKEHAEETAKATIARCNEINESKGGEPFEAVINVVPSPYVPEDHFRYAAQDLRENYDNLRKVCKRYRSHRDALLTSLGELLDEQDTSPAALKAKALIVQVIAEAELAAPKPAKELSA